MGFAKSGSSVYYSRRRRRALENREPGCRHEVMKGEDGFMVCQACGYMRFPYTWEDAGDPPMVREARAEQTIIRVEGSGTDF